MVFFIPDEQARKQGPTMNRRGYQMIGLMLHCVYYYPPVISHSIQPMLEMRIYADNIKQPLCSSSPNAMLCVR